METRGRLHEHIEKLRVLNCIGRTGSITKAAAALHITQSAASHSIRVLETVLDLKLLHRDSRGIRLTDSGQVLFEFSQRLLADVRTAEAMALNPNSSDAGALRIGTHETLAVHVWPEFLADFSERHPRIEVSLISGRTGDLMGQLLAHEYHALFTVEPTPHHALDVEVAYEGQMGLFVTTEARGCGITLAGQEEADLEELNRLPVLTDTSAHLRQNVSIGTWLRGIGFRLERASELNSFEASMRLAMHGLGIAIVPARHGAAYVSEGKLRPIGIRGMDMKTFGQYRICATILKERRAERVPGLFFEALLAHCRNGMGWIGVGESNLLPEAAEVMSGIDG